MSHQTCPYNHPTLAFVQKREGIETDAVFAQLLGEKRTFAGGGLHSGRCETAFRMGPWRSDVASRSADPKSKTIAGRISSTPIAVAEADCVIQRFSKNIFDGFEVGSRKTNI